MKTYLNYPKISLILFLNNKYEIFLYKHKYKFDNFFQYINSN